MYEKLGNSFEKHFGKKDLRNFFAPGRVNLIGEHTDYNGGHVFPCALSFGTYAVAAKREDKLVRLYSENFPNKGIIEFSIEDLKNEEEHDWANYSKGVIEEFKKYGVQLETGFEAVIEGTIPNGAGLSSSASLELLTAVILKGLYNVEVDMVEMVKMSQRAENQFVGVNCGIMDQFAIGMGKEARAILLDCNTLKYEYAPVELGDASIVIGNTNKRRGLADSKYNERRGECETALSELQEKLSIKALGELTIEEFEANKELIKDETRKKRAKHAVYENQRTLKAQKELSAGNLEEFGKLMNQSHISLRDDYEVTGRELDTLVEIAWEQEGVIGSRMTGAGFGGCTVSIVKKGKVDDFIKNVAEKYKERIGYDADFYVVEVSEGARVL